MERSIVHLNIPDFYTGMEELRRPELKKRPLVLAEPAVRSVVQGVNDAARREGIREGMPLGHARRICRRALVVPPDLRFYGEVHRSILQEFARFSPLVEGPLPGRYFVDLTGTRRLWGPESDTAWRMERLLADRKGLHARVGLASSKLVSQVAAGCITAGDLSRIFPGGETSFLYPLPVNLLPGVGAVTASRLADFNIQQVGMLASIPAESLAGVFGAMSTRLLRIARGIDPTPVLPFREAARLTLVHHSDRDEIDREKLEALLFVQVEEACWNLRVHNRRPGRFALEIRHADGVTAKTRHLLPVNAVHIDQRLFRFMLPAFRRLIERRVAVRRIVLEFSDFSIPFRQMPLFPWENDSFEEDRQLQKALDDIRRRFGKQIICWGKTAVMHRSSPGQRDLPNRSGPGGF